MGKRPTLQKLAPHHRLACAIKLTGQTHAKIAASLNTSKEVVDNWFKDPLVKEELERQTQESIATIQQKLAAGATAAIDVATRRVQAGQVDEAPIDEHHRIELMNMLLDRNPETRLPTETNGQGALPGGQGGLTQLLMIVGGLSNEELDELQGRLAAIDAPATEKS